MLLQHNEIEWSIREPQSKAEFTEETSPDIVFYEGQLVE